ncbi:Major facilitator superfamily domain general substrate transporter, partial [Penicillium sp. DV-2018c]
VVPPAIGKLGAVYETSSVSKNRAFSCSSIGAPLGYAGGMVTSGIAADISTWRTSFRVLAVLHDIFTVVGTWAFPPDEGNNAHLSIESLGWLDVTGTSTGADCLEAGSRCPIWLEYGICNRTALRGVFRMVGVKSAISPDAARYIAGPNILRSATHYAQVVAVQCLGEMGFSAATFWLSLLLQNVRKDPAIKAALELLPMIIAGIIVNVLSAFVLHKVSNQALTGVGSVAYTVAFFILSFLREEAPYWRYVVIYRWGFRLQYTYIVMKEKPNPPTTDIAPYLFTFRFPVVIIGISVFLIRLPKIEKQGGPALPEVYNEQYLDRLSDKPPGQYQNRLNRLVEVITGLARQFLHLFIDSHRRSKTQSGPLETVQPASREKYARFSGSLAGSGVLIRDLGHKEMTMSLCVLEKYTKAPRTPIEERPFI